MADEERAACPVEGYARAVLSGEILAGRLVRLACERHFRDLETGHERGLCYDPEAAERVFQFFSFLRLPADGELDGKAFNLEPFQKFIIGSLFGWKREDGTRRFRTAYIEMGKGSGKSPLAGGVGIYGMVADGEVAAEIYSAATTAFQAGILFRDARRMVEASPALRNRLTIGQHNLAFLKTDSFFRPVSSEHNQLSGPRPHMALIDEIHEHPNAMVVDKLRAGTKNRKQALVFEITNSGYDRTTVCWHHHEYSMKVLEGHLENDAWFAYVCQLDPCEKCVAEGQIQPKDGCEECDDWRDEAVWIKANPGLDTILPRSYIREQVEEAKGMPAKVGIVKRLNGCIWTEGVTRAIPMDAWQACQREIDPASLYKRECFGGLDIGATSDFTAFVLEFPHADEEVVEISDPLSNEKDAKRKIVRRSYTTLAWFWLPEHPVKRSEDMEQRIALWRRQGFIKTTPGDSVDYDQVIADIVELAALYDIREVAIDRAFQGHSTATKLAEHLGEKKVIAFPQGILSMAPPFRELLELLKTQRFLHDGNPVLRWMAANTVAKQKGGLTSPDKDSSPEKIDGISAATMALGRGIVQPPKPKNPYESRGIFAV